MRSLESHPVLALQLQGTSLIEASAGTGKTWSVAKLYVRALVEKQLLPSQILVMTFTRSATRELNERLLKELTELNDWLSHKPQHEFYSPWWLGVDAERKKSAVSWVRQCLLHFDEASIGTLQSFCEQVIQRYGFLFPAALAPEALAQVSSFSSNGVSQAVATVYGQEVFFINQLHNDEKDRAQAALCKEALGSYGNVMSAVLALLQKPAIVPLTSVVLEERRALCESDSIAALMRFREAATNEAVEDFVGFGKHYLLSAKPNKTIKFWQFVEVAQQMRRLSQTGSFDAVSPLGKKAAPKRTSIATDSEGDKKLLFERSVFERSIDRVISRTMSKCAYINSEGQKIALADLPLVQTLTAFRQAHERDFEKFDRYWASVVANCRQVALANLFTGSNSSFEETSLSFQRSVLLVGEGLQRNPAMAASLQKRYPVALIDEFQDTDPIQSKIIQAIYRPESEADYALVMVGDPKQAIYNFRGADVYAYLNAKSKATQKFSLTINQRSVQPLVTEVNAIFGNNLSASTQCESSGALPSGAFNTPGIEFVPVHGNPSHNVIYPLPAMRYVRVNKEQGGDCWHWCAAEIARLLHSGQALAGDVAVLVTANGDVLKMKAALKAVGISTRIQEKASIWLSPSALQMHWFLQGVLHFENLPLLRRALMTQFGAWVRGISNFNTHPEPQTFSAGVSELLLAAVSRLRGIWIERGIAALWAELNRGRLQQRTEDGSLDASAAVDSSHVMELIALLDGGSLPSTRLGVRSATHVLDRIGQSIADAKEKNSLQLEGDDAKRRTPATDNQVQVLTVHRSKGLQYNIVFLPKMDKKSGTTQPFRSPIFYPHVGTDNCANTGIELRVDLSSKFARHHQVDDSALAEQERENIRLTYVALTRAVHLCYWLVDKEKPESAGAKLVAERMLRLESSNPIQSPLQTDALNDAADCSDQIEHEIANKKNIVALSLTVAQAALQPAWSIESFSMLAQRGANETHRVNEFSTHQTPQTSLPLKQPERPDGDANRIGHDLTRLPKGSRTGECIHDALERCDWASSLQSIRNVEVLNSSVQRYGLKTLKPVELGSLINSTLKTPLFSSGERNFSLSEVNPRKMIREWRFDIAQPQTKAYLRGFVDLVFEHHGQYFIVDYKSNWLGPDDNSYTQEAMQAAMVSHQYDLQAKIYAAALRNFLATRLGHNKVQNAFGGVLYLFVRAMRPEVPGSGVFHVDT